MLECVTWHLCGTSNIECWCYNIRPGSQGVHYTSLDRVVGWEGLPIRISLMSAHISITSNSLLGTVGPSPAVSTVSTLSTVGLFYFFYCLTPVSSTTPQLFIQTAAYIHYKYTKAASCAPFRLEPLTHPAQTKHYRQNSLFNMWWFHEWTLNVERELMCWHSWGIFITPRRTHFTGDNSAKLALKHNKVFCAVLWHLDVAISLF